MVSSKLELKTNQIPLRSQNAQFFDDFRSNRISKSFRKFNIFDDQRIPVEIKYFVYKSSLPTIDNLRSIRT